MSTGPGRTQKLSYSYPSLRQACNPWKMGKDCVTWLAGRREGAGNESESVCLCVCGVCTLVLVFPLPV